MPLASTQERPGEVHRNQPVWRLCRADFGDHGCRLVFHNLVTLVRRPLRPVALRLAPVAFRLRRLHDRALVNGLVGRAMADTELRSRDEVAPSASVVCRSLSPDASSRSLRRIRVLPILITLSAVALST